MFALLGAAGIYDFWRWSYDYGHNLDLENAIIVVPDMTYQPPLIGTKQLLNFTATSLPAAGGIAAGVAFALAFAALIMSYRRRQLGPVAASAMLAATACAANPHIMFGTDACTECRMVVSDRRFGAVLVTSTGKSLPFDSVDCLLQYLESHPQLERSGTFVVDAGTPGTLIPAEQAMYVVDGALRPPMGSTVAYATVLPMGGRSAPSTTYMACSAGMSVPGVPASTTNVPERSSCGCDSRYCRRQSTESKGSDLPVEVTSTAPNRRSLTTMRHSVHASVPNMMCGFAAQAVAASIALAATGPS